MLTIGSIIEGAFGVLRRHPLSAVVWGLVQLLIALAMIFAMQPLLTMIVSLPPGNLHDPDQAFAMLRMMGPIHALGLVAMIVALVLWTAALRSVMRPSERGFAYLRLGMDELRLFGVTVVIFLLFYVILAIALVALVAACMAIDHGGSRPGAVIAGVVGGVLILAFTLVYWVRMALAGPLTVYRREIVIGEAWRLGAGHFWSMFLGFLVVALLVGFAQSVIFALTSGAIFASLFRSIGDLAAGPRMATQFFAQMASLSPSAIMLWAGIAVIGALRLALYAGMSGTAARLLLEDQGEAAEADFD